MQFIPLYFLPMTRFFLKIPIAYSALVLIWGSTWVAIKVSVGEVPFTMAAMRFFMAAIVLFLIQKFRKKDILPNAADLKVVLSLGIGNFFIGYGATYWGMQFVQGNITSILWATYPVVVSFTAHFMLKDEKITLSKIFSLIGALIGSYFIFDVHGQHFDPTVALGMMVILASVAGASYATVLYKREGKHLDPISTNSVAMLIGATLLSIPAFFFEPWREIQFTAVNLGATVYLAIFGSAIGFSGYFWLIKHVTIVKMSYINFLIPIIAGFWGWLLMDEGLTMTAFIGAVIILLSISIPEFRGLKKRTEKA